MKSVGFGWDDEFEATFGSKTLSATAPVRAIGSPTPVAENVASVAEITQPSARVVQQAPVARKSEASDTAESKRVNADDKRMINGTTDVNQLVPFKYKWAWEKYLASCANHWMPQEVNMDRDVAQWKSGALDAKQMKTVEMVLGFFSTADSLAANNIVLGTYRHITAPEVRQYLLRQAFEEAIHTHTYQYIIESLQMDEQRTFNAYNEIESIKAKDEFLLPFIKTLTDPDFQTGTPESDQKLLKSLIMFACVMEGLMFYGGFANVLAMGRSGLLPGACEQFTYILRDESNHASTGIDIVNTIKHENPHLWTNEFKAEIKSLFQKSVDLECAFIDETMPEPMLEIGPLQNKEYIKYICNRRCTQIGLDKIYPEVKENPLPWMSEMMDLKKEKNFFERKVTDYQGAASLKW